jgi:hypothetical protein
MRRVILTKDTGWFTTDKYAGIVVNTTISGDSSGKAEKIAFPRMVDADIQQYEAGSGVSVPVEFGLLQGFKLAGQSNTYTNVDFSFNIMKGKSRNGWGRALNALVDITKKLPMPANPFSEGFKFFADYANTMVESSVQEQKDNNLKQGLVQLSFSQNGQCSGDFESTGTILVIFGVDGPLAAGYVDIAKVNNDEYCWSAILKPSFGVKFGKKAPGGACVANTALQNDYYGFYLNAVSATVAAAPTVREDKKPKGKKQTFSSSAADAALSDVGFLGEELERKTETALEWDALASPTPFGQVLATTPEGVVWRVTTTESWAFDVAEALRRCAAHGVNAAECLPGIALSQPE